MNTPLVLVVQSVAKHYRRRFFELLHRELQDRGIRLQVIYSAPNKLEATKKDNIELDFPIGVKVSAHWIMGQRLIYQPIWAMARRADLVIVEQANKYLNNYLLLLLSKFGRTCVAFWGHGRNRQATRLSVSEFAKRWMINWVDWWFAYTKGASSYLKAQGFDSNRVTVVQNAADTSAFMRDLADVSERDVAKLREELGISASDCVALYCGSLYREKRLPFLLQAAEQIRLRVPNFRLLVVGDGVERPMIEDAARRWEWIHFLGARFGKQKATAFRIAALVLNPGLVGLAVLDAFAAGLPVFTTDLPIHSPEIEYLEDGVNGMMTRYDIELYCLGVLDALQDDAKLAQLHEGALRSAATYTLHAMVENFADGVQNALAYCACSRKGASVQRT